MVVALPLDFAGTLRVLRTKFLSEEPHGNEASRISFGLFQRLRSAFVAAVWSKKMHLVHVGAVLSLLDVPPDCGPGFYIVWCRFRLLRRYLAYNPREVRRLYCPLDMVAGGCPWHGPDHLLVESAGAIGHVWDSQAWLGSSLYAFFLATWLAHISIARLQFLMPGSVRFALSYVVINVFRGRDERGLTLNIAGSVQVKERDKALLRSILVGGESGMDFFSAMPEEKSFRSVFAATFMEMGNFSGLSPRPFGSNS